VRPATQRPSARVVTRPPPVADAPRPATLRPSTARIVTRPPPLQTPSESPPPPPARPRIVARPPPVSAPPPAPSITRAPPSPGRIVTRPPPQQDFRRITQPLPSSDAVYTNPPPPVQTVMPPPDLNHLKPRVPSLVGGADLASLGLDHRSGFLLTFIDGMTTVDDIIDACGIGEAETLRIIDDLVHRGVLTLK
jgi:hypothetical protein